MNKKIFITIYALMMLVFMLSGCGSNVSGTFINPNDNSETIVFDGDTIALYENGNIIRSGTFTESAKTASNQYLLRITYEGASTDERYWLNEDKTTISYYADVVDEDGEIVNTAGEIAFVKEN